MANTSITVKELEILTKKLEKFKSPTTSSKYCHMKYIKLFGKRLGIFNAKVLAKLGVKSNEKNDEKDHLNKTRDKTVALLDALNTDIRSLINLNDGGFGIKTSKAREAYLKGAGNNESRNKAAAEMDLVLALNKKLWFLNMPLEFARRFGI